jgi:ABC-2 type transport system ATP-binding protein
MLEVSHLSRSYGHFRAVDDISFQIQPGEIVGLLGHNGAGKTTIMKMLSGFIEPDSGTITVEGLDLATRAREVQRTLGYLPESPPVYPEMTIAEYLDYVGSLKGLEPARRHEEMRRVIRITDLSDRFGQRINTLSRGYRQRVGVAQALMGSPRLLILDEPTNGLDPAQTEQMREVIRGVASQATVILSTHIMQEVEAICDRVLMIHQGRLAVDEYLGKLTGSNALVVEITAGGGDIRNALSAIDGIESIDALPGERDDRTGYRVRFDSAQRAGDAGAGVSSALLGAGHSLHAIFPERRDLERLFAELTAGGVSGNGGENRDVA